MTCGRGSDHVSGLEQGLGDESQNMVVLREVEQSVAVTTNGDEAGKAQFGKVLRDCSRRDTDVVGKVVDRVLAVEQ